MLALEQNIKAELEQNPLLEEIDDIEFTIDNEPALSTQQDDDYSVDTGESDLGETDSMSERSSIDDFTFEDYQNDEFEYNTPESFSEEREEIPAPATTTLAESLLEQLPELELSNEEQLLAQEIIGNIGSDGYLRRDLNEIIADLNEWIEGTQAQAPSVLHTNGKPPASGNDSGKIDNEEKSGDSGIDGETGIETVEESGIVATLEIPNLKFRLVRLLNP